ncbi:hypothetical protein ES703_121027 [subsurface metagenome]
MGGGLKPPPLPQRREVKRFIALFAVVILMVLCAAPALAAGLTISPPSVEFDVSADGSGQVEFLVYDFNGNLEISLEDIPLRVEPATVTVVAEEEGTRVVLTFYGDESLDSQVFNGKIRFLAMTGGTVAMGIKVRATINHIASGQPGEMLAPPEESSTPPEQAPPPSAEAPATELPILLLAGIAAGTAIVITLIIVLARRPRY